MMMLMMMSLTDCSLDCVYEWMYLNAHTSTLGSFWNLLENTNFLSYLGFEFWCRSKISSLDYPRLANLKFRPSWLKFTCLYWGNMLYTGVAQTKPSFSNCLFISNRILRWDLKRPHKSNFVSSHEAPVCSALYNRGFHQVISADTETSIVKVRSLLLFLLFSSLNFSLLLILLASQLNSAATLGFSYRWLLR